MTLLDHFHPPLTINYPWHSVHNGWAYNLAAALNRMLPEQCRALSNVQFGIEIDVAVFDPAQAPRTLRETAALPYLAYAVASEPTTNGAETTWTAPPPALTMPFEVTPETVEVLVYDTNTAPTLVGAIELISPANKDRTAQRMAFVSKCESYLRQGVGLVIVDIVTNRRANLHNELLAHLGGASRSSSGSINADLYTSAYRPVLHEEQPSLDIWQQELVLGQPLPQMPLWLRGDLCLPVALDATYQRTCQDLRITAPTSPDREIATPEEMNR